MRLVCQAVRTCVQFAYAPPRSCGRKEGDRALSPGQSFSRQPPRACGCSVAGLYFGSKMPEPKTGPLGWRTFSPTGAAGVPDGRGRAEHVRLAAGAGGTAGVSAYRLGCLSGIIIGGQRRQSGGICRAGVIHDPRFCGARTRPRCASRQQPVNRGKRSCCRPGCYVWLPWGRPELRARFSFVR